MEQHMLKKSLMILLLIISNSYGFNLDINGFGTVAVNHDGNRNVDWNSTVEENMGVGYSTTTSTAPDTIMGVEFNINNNSMFSASAQVVSRDMVDNSYGPYFQWATLQIRPNANLLLRLGRIANDNYLYSDTRLVGQLLPVLHLPFTYQSNPIDIINGGSIERYFYTNDYIFTLSSSFGTFNREYDIAAPSVIGDILHLNSKLFNVHFNIEGKHNLFRIGTEQGHLNVNDGLYNQFLQSLNQLQSYGLTNYSQVVSQTKVDDISFKYFEVAYKYNSNNYLFITEYVKSLIGTVMIFPSAESFYVLGGIHFNNITPFIILEKTKQQVPVNSVANLSGPTALSDPISQINGYIQSVENGSFDISTFSAGMRVDITTKLDFKLQYDYILKPAGSQGGFNYINPNSTFINNREVIQLYSLGFDFVF